MAVMYVVGLSTLVDLMTCGDDLSMHVKYTQKNRSIGLSSINLNYSTIDDMNEAPPRIA